MITNIAKYIISVYLIVCAFVSNDISNTVDIDVEEYQVNQNAEQSDLVYREYIGTYVNLFQEASIIVTSTNDGVEEDDVVCLVNAGNKECIFKPFVDGVSFDNVASGSYYVYICHVEDDKIVDTSPGVSVFYPD